MLRRILNLAPDSAGGTGTPPAATQTPTKAASPPPAAGTPPASAPALPTSDNPPDDKADIFSDLDATFAPPPKPAAKPAEPAKPTAAEPPKKADAPATPPAAATPEPKGIKEMRDFGKRMETERNTLKSKVDELEAKRTEFEARGKDTENLTKRITELEGHIAERDKRLYALNVSEMPEFKNNFLKPFNDQANFAAETIGTLEVATATDPETGEVTAVRKADFNNDFVPIYEMARKSLTEARKMAKATFGEDAPTILNHVQELHRLDRARALKLKELQDSAESERSKEQAKQQGEKDFIAKAWRDVNTDIAEKNPEYFQPDPKDKERAEIWNKAMSIVDSRHNKNGLTLQQQVILDAQTRHRAAGYAVARYDLTKAKERIAELEADIAQYKNGGPGATKNPGGETSTNQPEKSFVEELNALEA